MTSSTKKTIARFILGIVALVNLAAGFKFMLAPAISLPDYLISAEGAEGLSNIRALLGAPLAAIGICVVTAIITANFQYAFPALISASCVFVGRVSGLIMDGESDLIYVKIAFPVGMFLLLFLAKRLLGKVNTTVQ